MIGFGIDQIQAEFVAEIKLRNINKEYILKRLQDTEDLEREIKELSDILKSETKIRNIIVKELKTVADKYGHDRRTTLVYEHQLAVEVEEEDETPDYPVTVFVSRGGYFKKITPQSLRMSGEQKYKEGDGPALHWEGSNRDELLVFTDRQQCYKTFLSEFEDSKASLLGDYLPSKLGMEPEERVLWACSPGDYSAHLLFCFDNGKVARVELGAYRTQTRRRRLTGAYSDKAPLAGVCLISDDGEMVLRSSDRRVVVFHTASLHPKATRTTQGVPILSLKPGQQVVWAGSLAQSGILHPTRYRARELPAAGALLREADREEPSPQPL
jgi:DNA gyrase subunit A